MGRLAQIDRARWVGAVAAPVFGSPLPFPRFSAPCLPGLSLPSMTGRGEEKSSVALFFLGGGGGVFFQKSTPSFLSRAELFFVAGQCAGLSVAGLFVGRMGVGRSWGWANRSECFFCSLFLGARKSGPKKAFFSQAAPDPSTSTQYHLSSAMRAAAFPAFSRLILQAARFAAAGRMGERALICRYEQVALLFFAGSCKKQGGQAYRRRKTAVVSRRLDFWGLTADREEKRYGRRASRHQKIPKPSSV